MDITSAFDVAAGLVLMYLVLSLLCTTINELIANATSLRAKTLAGALQQLIDDPAVKKAFDLHGLIDGAKVAASGGRKQTTVDPSSAVVAAPPPPPSHNGWISWLSKSELPNYLSSQSVSQALIGVVSGSATTGVAATVETVSAKVKELPDSNIRDALLAALTQAGTDMQTLQDSLANWYDNQMDRLSGAYKRYLQVISFIVGLVIAVLFNADTLHVGNALWHDRSLAQTIAQAAPQIATKACPDKTCAPAPSNQTLPIDTVTATFTQSEDNLRQFPIGWAQAGNIPADGGDWVWKVLGLLITAAALMMGAPFWFDALQKIMNVRSSGGKPAKAPTS